MKIAEYHFENPHLKTYLKRYQPGEHLFHQGDPGETLFIIVSGIVQLTAERDEQELVINTLEAGQVLGEKSLFSEKPFRRFFGAQAKSEVTVAELRPVDVEELEKKVPQLVNDILRRMCRISVQRLDRIDHLIKVLRPADNVERLVYLIVHFSHFEGRKTPKGVEIQISVDTIRYYIAMGAFEIEECLAELSRRDILTSEGDGTYLLKDQAALIQSVPQLREVLPIINTI